MNSPSLERALRKQQLILESDALRSQLAQQGRALAPAFVVADAARAGWQWLRAHPLVIIGAVAAVVVVQPRRVWRWTRRGWSLWRMWQGLRARLEPRPAPQ
jgi:hypothetical protein